MSKLPKTRHTKRVADNILPTGNKAILMKAKVTAVHGSPITTFDAQVGTKTAIPGISASVPFRASLAVNSVVWLLVYGPITILVAQES